MTNCALSATKSVDFAKDFSFADLTFEDLSRIRKVETFPNCPKNEFYFYCTLFLRFWVEKIKIKNDLCNLNHVEVNGITM